jgi:hypothetical protein
MGGQACVFYGAAEFSRDCDIVLLSDAANFDRLRAALDDLQAKCIAIPPFDPKYLAQGHAVHFRCESEEARGMRLDVMTRMRGVDEFETLWQRRTTLADDAGLTFELLGIHDLVKAKKTQRDKDWPMIRRLVESHYESHHDAASEDQRQFWLLESRTPAMLVALAADSRELAQRLVQRRALLADAIVASVAAVQAGLETEERAEKAADRAYWQPLKEELEELRRQRPRH